MTISDLPLQAPRAGAPGAPAQDHVVELRQYTLHPGQRDTLIELFEREFVETQEAVGMQVLGTFRDLDDADRFVWLRGFDGMERRAAGLATFYGGPVWRAHAQAANATMIDSDNVLLLRPAHPRLDLSVDGARRPAPGAEPASPAGLVVATVYPLAPQAGEEFAVFFQQALQPVLAATGAVTVAALLTDPRPNNFPRLPVREGEHVFVWLSCFGSVAAHDRHLAALEQLPRWRDELWLALARRLTAPAQTLRLVPTARSLLRAGLPPARPAS
jgi:hypothetical protein